MTGVERRRQRRPKREEVMTHFVQKNAGAVVTGVFVLVILAFIEMRITVGNMARDVTEALTLAKDTRVEQLLRTDEIDYIKQLRDNSHDRRPTK
jgi:hypothetical protein